MLSLLLDVGLDDSRLVDGTGSHTLDALERSADYSTISRLLYAGGSGVCVNCVCVFIVL